jgi:hypothetical protein
MDDKEERIKVLEQTVAALWKCCDDQGIRIGRQPRSAGYLRSRRSGRRARWKSTAGIDGKISGPSRPYQPCNSAHGTGRHSLSWQHSFGYQECASISAAIIRCFTAEGSCWKRHIKTNTARYRPRRDAHMAGVIVRRLQAFVRKPVALFGRLVVPKPAVADFLDFFTRHRMTVLVAAAFFRIPGMSSSGAIDQHHGRRQHAKMLRHL